MQILTGFMIAWSVAPAWRWVWIAAAIYWFFAGVGLAAMGLVKLASGKWRMGAASSPLAGKRHAPTDVKED
jgi:hypothetical protein